MRFRVFHVGETKVVHFRAAQGPQTEEKLRTFVRFTVREEGKSCALFGVENDSYVGSTHFREKKLRTFVRTTPARGGKSCALSRAAGCKNLC